MNEVRVRFAPSPTGNLHIGGARTALFNYLFAGRTGGKFLLRIEDTDKKRSEPAYVRNILESLDYLGIQWDDEPIYQSNNISHHGKAVSELLERKTAYRCFCDPEKLQEDRRANEKEKRSFQYPGYCRNISVDEAERRASSGEKYAVRFKVRGECIDYQDGVHGNISTSVKEIEDFVIQRRNGTPTYMLAVVVDDMKMGITHIIRGDDHISNTAKQILLHRALNNRPPDFVHIPLILGTDKKRLSKRHGAESVLHYREIGVLSDALFNHLALLGWYPGDDREFMSREEIQAAFSLGGLNNRSAVFDLEKLKWINGKHISGMDKRDLFKLALKWLEEQGDKTEVKVTDEEYLLKVLSLAKNRIHFLSDIFLSEDYYFIDPETFDSVGVKKHLKNSKIGDYLLELNIEIENIDIFDAQKLEEILRKKAADHELSAGKLIHPVRLALTGKTSSPGLFELMDVLGRETVIRRMGRFIVKIKSGEFTAILHSL